MKVDKQTYINYLLLIICSSLFLTCSPKLSYNIRSFLFDGVPDPSKVSLKVINDSIRLNDSVFANKIRKSTIVNEFIVHEPVKDRQCINCHDRESMGLGETKLPLPDLCYGCHKNFTEPYNTLHGPVASGACTQCHDPHKSKLKKLLKRKGQKLCFTCHTKTLVLENKIHKDIEDTDCIKCHNPHGGSNKFNLRAKSCYNCHDNFEKKFTFLHGPVASDNCIQCHDSHATKKPKLLIKTGQKLCYSCHNSTDISQNEFHKKIGNKDCITCHSPHGGRNKTFLLIDKN